MIPIAALLNDSVDEEKKGADVEIKPEPVHAVRALFGRQTSSVGCTSSDEMEDSYSPEDDEEAFDNQIKHERNSLTTTETSSLLGALTLQNLRFATTSTSVSDAGAAAATSSGRAYLSMDNLTNPMGDGEEIERDNNKPLTPSQEARAARRRSTRGLFPGASDEDRRAKQRMIVKRCYYKKINTINELRDQVQQLEGVLGSVLEEQEEQRDTTTTEAAAVQSVVDQYVDTVKDKEQLRHENQRLRKLADEFYMKNQGRLRVLLDANRKEMVLFTPAISDE